jgi:hypothetical protein
MEETGLGWTYHAMHNASTALLPEAGGEDPQTAVTERFDAMLFLAAVSMPALHPLSQLYATARPEKTWLAEKIYVIVLRHDQPQTNVCDGDARKILFEFQGLVLKTCSSIQPGFGRVWNTSHRRQDGNQTIVHLRGMNVSFSKESANFADCVSVRLP